MRAFTFFIIVVLVALFVYMRKAINAFSVHFVKVKNLNISKGNVSGVAYIQVSNTVLPSFNIQDVSLSVFINGSFVTPIQSVKNHKNGVLELSFNGKLKNVVSIDNVINALNNNTSINILGTVKISKAGFAHTLDIEETILV